jgi:hypothetical protein
MPDDKKQLQTADRSTAPELNNPDFQNVLQVQIGKSAKLAGVSVDTIRFYQKLKLIKSAGRTALKCMITAS